MSDNSAAIAKLTRTFGNVDKDVLAAILEVCGGNADEAVKFLQAEQGQQSYDMNQLQSNTGIPKDYPIKGVPQKISANFPAMKDSKQEKTEITEAELIKALFISENKTYQEHYDTQKSKYELYTAVLLLLINQGVEISKASRPRILAAAWSRKDKPLAEYLLSKEEIFSLPHVLGALNLLDASRKIRAVEKKVTRLEKQGSAKAKTIGALKSSINDLKREAQIGSLSGALSKQIRQWVGTIPSDNLEFFALNMPKNLWKDLADLVHVNPKDFQCPWFLEFIFDKEPPEDSIVKVCANLTSANVIDALKKGIKIPYSFLRTHIKPLPAEAKDYIVQYAPLDTLIWWYEELACSALDKVLDARLDKEKPSFAYGKLMERLLYFKGINAPFFKKLIPMAEERLASIQLELESPVVVIGDASYSMDVAIRVSTVIASVLCCLCGAELKFFTGECVDPPLLPRNITQVLDLTQAIKADGLTAPAAALWPYYQKKKVVKFFIVVTDEIENEKYKDTFFPSLFYKYYTEVFPAKIVFVSFLENPSEKGRMVTALEAMGINPLQFKLDGKRPDLTKLDSLLGLLASESTHFPKQVEQVAAVVKDGGVTKAVQRILNPSKKAENKIELETHSNNNAPSSSSSMEGSNKGFKIDEGKEAEVMKIVVEEIVPKKEESKECVICLSKPADTALLDCGHLSFCGGCAEPLKECPICRAKVVKTVRIYH